jgi:hypothetical protein
MTSFLFQYFSTNSTSEDHYITVQDAMTYKYCICKVYIYKHELNRHYLIVLNFSFTEHSNLYYSSPCVDSIFGGRALDESH